MNDTINKHVFAFITSKDIQSLATLEQNSELLISDMHLVNRIQNIVRLQENEEFILFDQYYHIRCKIISSTKKNITVLIVHKEKNKNINPPVTCIVPLLKREALEHAIDVLTQLSITKIQLVTTEKTHRKKLDDKEFARLERLIHAAAEQSKNYSFPTLAKPIPLATALSNSEASFQIFLDPNGEKSSTVLSKMSNNITQTITLIVGPEGDLSQEEKHLLKSCNVTFMALTATVLRAEQAIIVAAGIMRSLLNF